MAIFGPARHQPNRASSPNYHGDPNNPRNQSMWWIPDRENCSFWLQHLPRDVTVNMLLKSIRNMGRIYATHINNEECQPHGTQEFAGAKVIFFTAEDAQKFFTFAVVERRLVVGGLTAWVVRNRTKIGPQYGLSPTESRVLLISGASRVVNVNFLTRRFTEKFKWVTDEIIDHGNNGIMAVLEWRFSSWRSQAHDAFLVLTRDTVFKDNWVQVKYDKDPCAFHQGALEDEEEWRRIV